MKNLINIRDRVDALASQALEEVVKEAEVKDSVKVTQVQVNVGNAPSGHPALDVTVEIKHAPNS